jgi:uncharacterized protein (DUF1810 family)
VPVKQVFGELDALKFASCMTLFAAVTGDGSLYAQTLNSIVKIDLITLEILEAQEKRND